MRIDVVLAEAFGPFNKKRLDLAPGMNVVHGPNEAGKSSWFAATRAGLCGIRRARGRGSKDEREFKDRHKPWHARGWKVGTGITLDDGRRLELMHDLGRGVCQLKDQASGSVLDSQELENDGTADGSLLLGLNRTSARATIFVGQADILRVFTDADGLQEFLQRAATSHTVDTTAEEALEWLADQRRTRVGQPHLAQRPLGIATKALEEARKAADEARDLHDQLQGLLVERGSAARRLAEAEERTALISAAVEWMKIDALRERIRSVRMLQAQRYRPQGQSAVDEALIRRVTEAVGALQERGAPPSLPSGDAASEVRAQLDALPEPPEGDVEVEAGVSSTYEATLTARAELANHDRSKPAEPEPLGDDVDPERLRSLARRIEQPRPVVDPSLNARLADLRQAAAAAEAEFRRKLADHGERLNAYEAAFAEYTAAVAQYEQERESYGRNLAAARETLSSPARRSNPSSRRNGMPLILIGIVLLALGIGAAAAVHLAIGGVFIVAGFALGIAGTRARFRAGAADHEAAPGPKLETAVPVPPAPPAHPRLENPGPAPGAPAPDASIAGLQVRMEMQAAEARAHDEQEARAREELSRLSLPADPARLKQMAAALESRTERERNVRQWSDRRRALAQALDKATRELLVAIGLRMPEASESPPDGDGATVDHAIALYRRYESDCRRRAEQASRSSRRPDLERALASREEADRRYAEALRGHRAVAERVLELARELGVAKEGLEPEAALRGWLDAQKVRREEESRRQQAGARLEQLLDGVTMEQLLEQLQDAEDSAAPRPATTPEDPHAELSTWTQRRQVAADEVSRLTGQASQLQARLPSVAEAIEREEEAERRLQEVNHLARVLDLAEQGLQAAKEKVNASIAPALTERIRPWLPRVTDGRYSDLLVNPETLLVKVREAQETYRAATVLSHGTMEQVYLLLRLALADLLATRDETAPVVLDDVTVQSDPQRTVALLELLHEISRERQVILFTQEQEVVDWGVARLASDRDRMIELAPILSTSP